MGACLGGCSGTGAPYGASPSGTGVPAGVYVSVGDSYAAGFQPEGYPTDHGFADEVTRRLAPGPRAVQLVNLGCPGITARGIVADVGCASHDSAPHTLAYPGMTQLQALESTLASHRGVVRFVTVIAGANDLERCFADAEAVRCARATVPGVRDDLATVLATVRRAAPDARIVGLTYPDVYLGLLLTGSASDAARARQSVAVFRDVLNPALREVYTAAGAAFVDVTAQGGAYEPETVTAEQQGRTVPRSVAVVCAYSHFCESGDVHPDDAGYNWYADQVLAAVDGAAATSSTPRTPASPGTSGAPGTLAPTPITAGG